MEMAILKAFTFRRTMDPLEIGPLGPVWLAQVKQYWPGPQLSLGGGVVSKWSAL